MEWMRGLAWLRPSGEKGNGKTSDYWDRPLPSGQAAVAGLAGTMSVMLVVYVFYESFTALILLAPLGLLALPVWRKRQAEKRRERFLMQYQDLLYYLSAALSAGKSAETAFVDSASHLSRQYGHADTELCHELGILSGKVGIREPLEVILSDMAERTGLEDVRRLAEVISICRKSGGNLVEVIQQSVRVLREKIHIRREMETAWASKRLEQRILCVSPVFLVLLLKVSGSGFLVPMYETLAGRFLMTVSLLLVVAGYALGAYLMRPRI